MKHLVLLLLLATAVYAGGDALVPRDHEMEGSTTVWTEYCVTGIRPPNATVEVVVDPVCRDTNGISGCQPEDDVSQDEVSVMPISDIVTVNGYGCTNLSITASNASGTYYYTVNGRLGGVRIASETGSSAAHVPEMSVVGSALVLLGVGIYLKK